MGCFIPVSFLGWLLNGGLSIHQQQATTGYWALWMDVVCCIVLNLFCHVVVFSMRYGLD
jgi:hypothetical protein